MFLFLPFATCKAILLKVMMKIDNFRDSYFLKLSDKILVKWHYWVNAKFED